VIGAIVPTDRRRRVEGETGAPLVYRRDSWRTRTLVVAEMTTDGPCRILVAEDDDALRETLVELLETPGHELLSCPDGQAALEMLEDGTVDVLVLDMHMPKLDGLSLLRRINVPPPNVIVYSAFEYYDSATLKREVGAKFVASLQKPVAPAVLISAVQSACPSSGH
jgi:CheY-like chemotaxis protein